MTPINMPMPGASSPWGTIQTVTPLGPDAASVSTASHGGIWISGQAFERIPAEWRETSFSGRGWFEEDCDWCIPYLALGLGAFDHRDQTDYARNMFARQHKGDVAALEGVAA